MAWHDLQSQDSASLGNCRLLQPGIRAGSLLRSASASIDGTDSHDTDSYDDIGSDGKHPGGVQPSILGS
jgi:hypothetical protein